MSLEKMSTEEALNFLDECVRSQENLYAYQRDEKLKALGPRPKVVHWYVICIWLGLIAGAMLGFLYLTIIPPIASIFIARKIDKHFTKPYDEKIQEVNQEYFDKCEAYEQKINEERRRIIDRD